MRPARICAIALSAILLFSTFTQRASAEDAIYLQINSDKQDSFAKGNVSTSVSANRDNSRLAVSYMMSSVKDGKFTGNYASLLMDLSRGKVLNRIENGNYQYIGDYLLRFDYANAGSAGDIAELHKVTRTTVIDPYTFAPIKELPLGNEVLYVTYFQDNYMLVQYQQNSPSFKGYNVLYYLDNQLKLHKLGQFDVANGQLSADKKILIGTRFDFDDKDLPNIKQAIVTYDVASGRERSNQQIPQVPLFPKLAANGEIYYGAINSIVSQQNEQLHVLTENGATRLLGDAGVWTEIDQAEKHLLSVSSKSGAISLWDLQSKAKLSSSQASYFETSKDSSTIDWNVSKPFAINGGKQFLIGYSNGIISLYSVKQQAIVANLFFDKNDWAVVANDGRMDGTPGAFEKLEWHTLRNNKVINKSSLSAAFNKAYTPYLLSSLMNDEPDNSVNLAHMLTRAPKLSIISPQNEFTSDEQDVTVVVKTIEQGDPLAEVQLFVNGKLAAGNERGLKAMGEKHHFELSLSPGENVISAKALSQQGYESALAQIKVHYRAAPNKSRLHILAIGIDDYYNPKYKLNYAIADATAFSQKVEQQAQTIFADVSVDLMRNSEVNKANLLAKFEQLANTVQDSDVFVFYYAGHGVMNEGTDDPLDFYLALYDVTQLYGNDTMLVNKGFSAAELRANLRRIKAQKQLLVFDACQSGAAVDTFASRGAAEEKAMMQLARSAGVVLIASSGSEQFASEFDALGHGVFTYSLLEGMSGQADGRNNDKKITAKELEAWVNDRVPALSQQYKGAIQFPQSWSKGQDFPLVIVE